MMIKGLISWCSEVVYGVKLMQETSKVIKSFGSRLMLEV